MNLIPPRSAQTFIDLDGGRVRVLRSTAEVSPSSHRLPMLLIHGGGTDNAAISWYHAFDDFGSDREVIALDLPGFGLTSGIAPVGGARELADFVARAAARLDIDRAVVVGVSMGGEVALQLALRHLHLVEALVVIAPGGLIPVFRPRIANFGAWLGTRIPDPVLRPLARLANRFAGSAIKAVVKDPSTLPPEALKEFIAEAQRPGAGMAYAHYNRASLGPWSMRNNLLPVVDQISAPTLLFHGDDDPIVDPAGSRRASELMPHAKLVTVPNCGHWAQLEAPDRFRTEVRNFLNDAP